MPFVSMLRVFCPVQLTFLNSILHTAQTCSLLRLTPMICTDLPQKSDFLLRSVPFPLFERPAGRIVFQASVTKSPTRNADPSYKRCTLTAIPTSDTLHRKTKLPFALVVTPFRSVSPSEPPVPVVEDRIIARCRRCRSYINPFVTFIDGGSRWKCIMCNVSNEVPALFDWDDTAKKPADRWKRHELNHAVVDFVAPNEYMVRPPQAVCYVFLVDVGPQARQSGMVGVVARCIAQSLDKLPNSDGSTRVAFLAFDDQLHFFHIVPTSAEFTLMVVSDVDDVYLPRPTDLLVNLQECRTAVDALLGKFEEIFGSTHASGVGSAMGPALQAGFQLIVSSGVALPSCDTHSLSTGSDRRKAGCPLIELTECRSRGVEGQGGPKRARYSQGISASHTAL